MADPKLATKRPIRVILFDLGGTLIYEDGPWEPIFSRADEALWEVLHRAGVDMEPRNLYGDEDHLFGVYYLHYRGDLSEPTSIGVLDELLRAKGVQLPTETLRDGLQAMYTVTQANWLPEEDAQTTLELLKERGYRMGLISNAADDANTQALIDKGRFRPYFEFILSSAAFGLRKPHTDIFRSALRYFHISPEEAVMVGDNFEADILGAHNAGIQSIWITRRASTAEQGVFTVEPDAVVTKLSELPDLLAANQPGRASPK